MMQKMPAISAFLLTLAFTTPHANAAGQSGEDVTYSVKSGDTLIDLGQKYLTSANSYKIVQKKNNIGDPRALTIGKKLYIPRNLLKYKSASARLLSVRGNVSVGGAPAFVGQVIDEGATITTAAASFVTLGLGDGSRVSLPSNSSVNIRLLRNYALGGALDYDFDLAKGGAQSRVVPLKSKDDRFRVRTPKAVSAVRGTDFQSRYDSESDQDFAEVVEGALAVGTGTGDLALPAGKGLSVNAQGGAQVEDLLPAPTLLGPGKIQVDPNILFSANQLPTEFGYRFTLSKDAGFVEQIADAVVAENHTQFSDIPNGNYFLRARAISKSGLQGIPVTTSFKRRLNGVNASAGQSEDGYAFKWFSQGEGIRKFHFQLFRDSTNTVPVIDEPALDTNEITMSDLAAGQYFWRVGSVQYLDGEASTNWTSFEKLDVAP
jgi:hypothetical protein